MALDPEKLLDDTGWQILGILQENARLSFAEVGRRVGLSLPAVSERVRRLEEAGIIRGYRAEVDPVKVGLPLTVFVRLITTPQQYPRVRALVAERSGILECHHVTGGDSFMLKIVIGSMAELEELLGELSFCGQTVTSIVLSSMITRSSLDRPQ